MERPQTLAFLRELFLVRDCRSGMVHQAAVSHSASQSMEYLSNTLSSGLTTSHISLACDTPVCQGVVKCVYIYIDSYLTEANSFYLGLECN